MSEDSANKVHTVQGKPQSPPGIMMWAPRGAKSVAAVGAPARRHTCAVRVPGVTLTATMRQPHVPRLSTDALPYRTPMDRVWGPHKERRKRPKFELMNSVNGSMNCANSLKPLAGVLGSECVLRAWAEGCGGSVLGLVEVSFQPWWAYDTSPPRR